MDADRIVEQEQARRAAPPPAPPAAGTPPLGSGVTPPVTTSNYGLGVQLPKIITSSQAMDEAVKGMLQGQKALNAAMPAAQAKVEGARAAVQGELDKPLPQAPTLRDIPQYQPRQLDSKELLGFAGLAMALAGLGTKAMRGDITTALTAAGSAMKGFNEGNIQQGKIDLENFKKQMDSVIAENHKMSEQYRGILENRKLSLQQKDQALRVAAAARDDQVMLSALSQGQLKMVFDLEAHRINASNQAALKAATIYNTAQWHQKQMEMQREVARLRTGMGDGASGSHGLSTTAIDNAASYFILNGRMPVGMSNVGRGALQAIQNRAGEMTQKAGLTPEEFAAAGPVTRQKLGALLALEKQRNAIQAFEGMLDLNIGILKDLSKKVERSDSPYANKPILWLQQNASGDPDVAEYLFQVNTVQAEAARILQNPNLTGQLTDTARNEMQAVIRGELNPEQLDRVLARAQSDARNRSRTLDQQSDKVIAEIKDPLHKAGGGGSSGEPAFATEAEATAAAAAGKIKAGQRIKVGGKSGVWQ